MITIGIDPGTQKQHSGIALVDCIKTRVLEACPVPVVKSGTKGRAKLDEGALLDMFARIRDEYPRDKFGPIIAMLEDVGPMPKDGSVGAFSFGAVYGGLRVAILGSGFRLELERPNTWKQRMKVPSDKGAAVARADAIFPEDRHFWRGPKGGAFDGIAEAAMLAKYCGDLWLPQLRKVAA